MSGTQDCPRCGATYFADDGTTWVLCVQCRKKFSISSHTTKKTATVLPSTPKSFPPLSVSPSHSGFSSALIYLAMRHVLHKLSINLFIWGIFYIVLSLGAGLIANNDKGSESPFILATISLLAAVTGIVLVSEAIWLTKDPSATGLQIAAITMMITTILITRHLFASLLTRHTKYGQFMSHQPSPAELVEANAVLDTLLNGKLRNTPELIEFYSVSKICCILWRGLLLDDRIVLIAIEEYSFNRSIADIYMLTSANFSLHVFSPGFLGFGLNGACSFNTLKVNCTIPPECYQRYQEWKEQQTVSSVQHDQSLIYY